MKISSCLIALLLVMCGLVAHAQESEKIASVSIVGYERLDKGFIANQIKAKEGDLYSLDKLREDMRSIYRTGYFSDVQIDVKETDKGKTVTFVVVERPPIKAIYIAGNKKVRTEDITDRLKVKSNTVLNTEKIKESMDEIRKLYASKAYYATKVNYALDQEEGATDVAIRFAIEEPEMAYVRKITIKGAKAFKEKELKDVLRTKEKGLLSWFTGSGILDEETLEDDRKNIEAFYTDHGYVRARSGLPDVQVSKDGKSITIVFSVDEGNVYAISDITFSGDLIFSKEELLKRIKSKAGSTFRGTLYHDDVLTLADLYQEKGYAFAEVVPLTSIDDDARKISINFEIAQGKEIFVNRVNITGNVKTRDKVIRRELRLAEGDRFSSSLLRLSKKKLRNTTYFKEVDMKLTKTDEADKVNLDVAVEEKPTGTFSIGVGYSSSENVILTGSVSQENLLGTGRKLFLEAALSSVTHEFRFSFVEPYLFDKNIQGSTSIFNYSREFDTYDYAKTGGSISLARPVTEDVKLSLSYRFERANVTNIDADASTFIKEQRGTATTSSVTTSISKNSIDDVLNPSSGVVSSAAFEFAGGPFGGTNSFYKSIGSYGYYLPLKLLDSTFFLRGTAGAVRSYDGKDVPIYERFFVGGINTVRGFKYGEAGPMDETDEVIGANNELFFNFEWIFPIYKPAGVKGVLFYDLGHGFDDNKGFLLKDIRAGAGGGIRWFSPLGPIRLELGMNLFPRKGEKQSVFEFAIGTQY